MTTTWPIDDVALGSDPTVPNGEVRGIYDAAVRPGTSELWVAHVMLASSTPQPMLDFNTTVPGGAERDRMRRGEVQAFGVARLGGARVAVARQVDAQRARRDRAIG